MSSDARGPKIHRTPNLAITVLVAIYVVALISAIVLYFVGFAVRPTDAAGAADVFAWGNRLGVLGVFGGMLHLAVGAIRHIVEDNARR
ncbi:hypothetical protein [Leifsonia shinshuensis]|uniref:Uncharacterized protein n=1 Tax=Leifsonia shinshuensis TaxID=150026 RepID=A0A7G6YD39_9MICO|nr:hypothetical protein [Leifsonia shinshuensis]QNE36404.1 hypothetical protein F1C12_15645 [Leifsonia shinshuensis]